MKEHYNDFIWEKGFCVTKTDDPLTKAVYGVVLTAWEKLHVTELHVMIYK